MSFRTFAVTILFGLAILAFGGCMGKPITGKFLLSEYPEDTFAPDAIDFHSDGSCLADFGKRTAVPGKFHTYLNGRMKIEANPGTQTVYNYKYQALKHTLVLVQDDETALIYVRPPEEPHPEFSAIVGIFKVHTDLGDSAGEITADHQFREHFQILDPDTHTYEDVHLDGKCSYTDGVVTYMIEHSDAVEKDKYLRDFIVKRDAQGLWIIDQYHDSIICQTPATDLELPPPAGYRKSTR